MNIDDMCAAWVLYFNIRALRGKPKQIIKGFDTARNLR